MRQRRSDVHGCVHWLWLTLAVWLVATAAQAGNVTVRAFLDRDHVQLGDTVTLNVEVDGSTQAQAPDVSALQSDFDILGTSHNTSVNIVNGRRSVQSLWAIGLRPRHAGSLTIPALTVDGRATAPLTLTVGPAPATAQGGPGDPVFIRVEPSTRTPYVGEQIDLAVKLFYAPDINSGSLNLPHGQDIEVHPLGKGTRYQSERSGRIYRVLEKHYAVTAQHAGPLNLSPVTFQGSMAGPGGFAGFFGHGQDVTARSAPIRLAVRARPASSGKGAWLPARKLTLQLAGLPADGRVEVGQSLTLTLTEKAVGLPFESLPEPQLPKLEGVDVYPDQSQDHTGDDGHWLEGSRTRKFALVPQRPGTLTIPAITLQWWNVETNRKEVARIPAHTLTVAAATGRAGRPAPAVSAAPAAGLAPAASVAAKGQAGTQAPAAAPSPGHLLAWLALGLWLITVLAAAAYWWRKRRRSAAPASPGVSRAVSPAPGRHLQQAFLDAARHADEASRCDSLLAWARAERPAVHNLGELAAALASAGQRDAIDHLQRARYAGTGDGPEGETLVAAFRSGFAWRDRTPSDTADAALPPLYPQDGSG